MLTFEKHIETVLTCSYNSFLEFNTTSGVKILKRIISYWQLETCDHMSAQKNFSG